MAQKISKNDLVIALISVLLLSVIINYSISSTVIKTGPEGPQGKQGKIGPVGIEGPKGEDFNPAMNRVQSVTMDILFMKREERFKVLFCLEKFLFKRKRMSGLLPLLKMAGSTISTLRLTAINLFWGIFIREKLNPFFRQSMQLL